MPVPAQRRALGTLFLVLAFAFAGAAWSAARAHVWPVAVAAAVLAAWMVSLVWQQWRRH